MEARKGRGTRHHCQPYLRHGHCQGHENCYRTEGPPAEWAGTQGRSPLQVRHRQVENIPVPAQRRSGNGAGGRDTAGCRTRGSSQGSSLKGETATRRPWRAGLLCRFCDGASHAPSETGGVALELREVRDGPLRDRPRLTRLPHPRNREGKSTHGLHDKEACRLPACVRQKQTVIARGSKLRLALCLVWNQKPRNSHKNSRRTSRSKCNNRRSETARKRRTGLPVNIS